MLQMMKGTPENTLIDEYGQRKYLNQAERKRFYKATAKLDKKRRLFCLLIYYTGVRISEALHLKVEHIDFSEKAVTIKSLKKRGKVHYRQIPLPNEFLKELKTILNETTGRVWTFSRSTASRFIKKTMSEARISGTKACSRGLRHSFAVNSVMHNVPLTLIQKWMGHASITTTAIYLNVLGAEERNFAKRTWQS